MSDVLYEVRGPKTLFEMTWPQIKNPKTQSVRELLMEKCDEYDVPLAHFLHAPFEDSVVNSIGKGAKVLVAGRDVSLMLQICTELREVVDKVA